MQVDLDNFRERVRNFERSKQWPDAKSRYNALKEFDPFSDVPAALLHSGHVASYAIATGMIDPFDLNGIEKPATYLVPLEGPVRYLDDEGRACSFYLSTSVVEGENDVRSEFMLMPNSICYITLKPTFRMPAYLAGRFNLLIKDVYRGLLVGTGPLVDPGFVGRLSIPVHNFTSNSYCLRAGDGFVYFEFTKLSWKNPAGAAIPSWVPQVVDVQPPFPASKNARKELDDYIRLATGGGPPQNAIHAQVKKLLKTEETVRSRLRIISVGAVVAAVVFLLTVAGVVVAAWQLFLGAQQYTQAAQKDLLDAHEKLSGDIKGLRNEFEDLRTNVGRAAAGNVTPRRK